MPLLHLIGHDGTAHGDDALALARTLGTGLAAHRIVVHVLPGHGPTTPAEADALAALEPRDSDALARIRLALQEDEVLLVLQARSPARGLHDHAELHGAALIVVGAHHPSTNHLHLATGTVAASLLAGGPCAIAHAPRRQAAKAPGLARIVVGYDGSREARDAVREAAVLATAAGGVVDVVYAYDHTSFPRYQGTVGEGEAAADELAQEGLQLVPEPVRGISVGQSGSSGTVIEGFAQAQGAALVVLGSRGFGPVMRTLIGSTGSHVLHHSSSPVLILPRGTRATQPEHDGSGLAVA